MQEMPDNNRVAAFPQTGIEMESDAASMMKRLMFRSTAGPPHRSWQVSRPICRRLLPMLPQYREVPSALGHQANLVFGAQRRKGWHRSANQQERAHARGCADAPRHQAVPDELRRI